MPTPLEIAQEIAHEMNNFDHGVGIFEVQEIDETVVEDTIDCEEDNIKTIKYNKTMALVEIEGIRTVIYLDKKRIQIGELDDWAVSWEARLAKPYDEDAIDSYYPESERLKHVINDAKRIGNFLEWLSDEREAILCKFTTKFHGNTPVNQYLPVEWTTERILADYFGIDLDVVEIERQDMLKKLGGN